MAQLHAHSYCYMSSCLREVTSCKLQHDTPPARRAPPLASSSSSSSSSSSKQQRGSSGAGDGKRVWGDDTHCNEQMRLLGYHNVALRILNRLSVLLELQTSL